MILVGYPDLIPSPGSRFTECGWLTDKEKPRVWKLGRNNRAEAEIIAADRHVNL